MTTGRLMDSAAVHLPGIKKESRSPSPWLPVYIYLIVFLGFGIVIIALNDIPADWLGLLLFAGLAGMAQLGDVELFSNSRSRISVSPIIAISSILLFGPLAGALVHMVSGLMTAVTTTFRTRQSEAGRAPWIKRMGFNTGMFVIATAIAGWTYLYSGGSVGNLWQITNLFPLFAAATVDVLVNIAILIGVIALQTGRNPYHLWKQDFRWSAPISVIGGALGGGVLASAYEMFHFLGLAVFVLPVLAISYSFRTYVSNMKVYVDKLEVMNRDLDEVNLNLLGTLGAIIDVYDVYTYGHSKQVAAYSLAFAEKMALPAEEQDRIIRAALIHDLGKVGIMDSIISKPGPLSDEEYNTLKRHPVIGAEIVGRMKGLQDLVPLVRHHHERWDGRGYPDGIAGDDIPLGARIMALADSLDAMLSDRPYRPTRELDEVVKEVMRCSGSQFDPVIVEAFLKVLEEKPSDFFKNSAASVDKSVVVDQMGSINGGARYFHKKDWTDDHKN